MTKHQNRISKNGAGKDKQNTKQRRADAKRIARLTSEPHLAAIAADRNKHRYRQAQRWVDHEMKTGQILGYQNEIRWGLKKGRTNLLSDEAQWHIERMEKERRDAFAAAGLNPFAGPNVVVDDWFGQTGSEDVTGGGSDHGRGVEGGSSEQQMEDAEGKELDEPDVEMGGV